MGLPFLVTYGPWVWKLVLASGVAGSASALRAVRHRRVRRAARELRDALARDATAPRVGAVVLRSTITSGTATTVAQQLAAHDATTALVLACGTDEISIEGAVHVEAGAKTRRSPHVPSGLGAKLPDEPCVVRTVGVGDDVIVSGVLAMAPASSDSEPGSYREARVRWSMTGDPTIRVIAATPHATPIPRTRGQLIASLLVLTSLWFGALYVAGKVAIHVADDRDRDALRDGHLPELGAAEIAAALPGQRTRALEIVEDNLASYPGAATERAFALQVELSELRGRCPVRIYAGRVRLEPALAAARRCGTKDEEIAMLAFLGRYTEAEHALAAGDRSEAATTIRIATGNWLAAADGIDAKASLLEQAPPGKVSSSDDAETRTKIAATFRERPIELHCLAALLRTYGGASDAFARVKDRGVGSGCRLLEATAKPAADQAAAFAAIPELPFATDPTEPGWFLLAGDLAYAVGPPTTVHSFDGIFALTFSLGASHFWLAPYQLAVHPGESLAETNMAVVEMFHGNLLAARAHAANTKDFGRDSLAILIALRGPGPVPASWEISGARDAIALRRGEPIDRNSLLSSLDEHGTELLARSDAGDGMALVELLEQRHIYWRSFASPLLGLLPRITNHREDVIAALRLFRDDLTAYSVDYLPFRTTGDMMWYRDLARLAGDAKDANAWQAIIDRHAAVLADRQKLTAFLFWAH